ncbi:MAG: HEPN domain-containing protein [Candidatus Omnitrophica bacterium]|nr:HEPN domain-containing protein [Candidatus Omnitrophota bacterium]
MKERTKLFLEKAGQSLVATEQLLSGGNPEFAAGRAYYAMFYVAEALLNEKGFRFKKHGGVHGAFGEHFSKTGLLDAKYHRWLLASFEERITGDYEVSEPIEAAKVETMLQQAREFLEAARNHLTHSK